MLQIDRRLSAALSYIFSIFGFFALTGFCIYAGINLSIARQNGEVSTAVFVTTILLGLAVSLIVTFGNALLLGLLTNIRKNKIFSASSVLYLRLISWSSIAVGLISIPLCFLWKVFPWITLFIGLFLGLVLRVVKNVIEEAVAIKEDNDSVI